MPNRYKLGHVEEFNELEFSTDGQGARGLRLTGELICERDQPLRDRQVAAVDQEPRQTLSGLS